MEMIVISESQLKIMMSAEDMKKYKIDDPVTCTDLCTRMAIRTMLDEAKYSCGYDTDGCGVFVSYFPSRQGGGEFFITKIKREITPEEASIPPRPDEYIYDGYDDDLGDDDDYDEDDLYDDDDDDDDEFEIMKNDFLTRGRYKSGYIIYQFEKLDDLIRCCAAVSKSGTSGESLAYSMDIAGSGRGLPAAPREYFLLLKHDCLAAAEYAASRVDSSFLYVLEEHGRLLCRNAADVLGSLA